MAASCLGKAAASHMHSKMGRRDNQMDNGPATAARLRGACGLAVDALGNLFLTDYKRIDPTGNGFEVDKNSRVREVLGIAVPR
jgi:hypothetical protein